MKYLHLLWASLFRKRARTVLTLLSIAAAFCLFGMLDAVRIAFNGPENINGIDRMVVASRFSIIQSLPLSYAGRIQTVPGVKLVSWANWFGGIYQDEKNFFANFAVSPESTLDANPEFVLSPAEREAFLSTRTGAIVGATLAKRFGWKLGDKIPLKATIYPNKDGTNTWIFDLVGIFHASEPKLRNLERQMLFRYDYFDEGRTFEQGTVGWYTIRIDDPGRAEEIARTIDRMFANSPDETRTDSERAWELSFAKQIGDIGLIVSAIMAAVFFTLLLLTGNTMAQAIRERIPELAVLKTIGFSNRGILALVLAESALLLVLGGLLGLLLTRVLLPVFAAASEGRFDFVLPPQTWLSGVGLMLTFGLAVGLAPALRAMRLRIVDALAGH
ncbi:MAG: FtsX-like permease family protein [Gammaproteobacteria bacterium]|nr:FtsX-like permease family protein [Gammaproteobacteria bacterium]